jgi:hypothetical protein
MVMTASVAVSGALLGIAAVYFPLWTVVALLLSCAAVYFVAFYRTIPYTFLGSLWILLLGYALLGRSFAYLGAPPIFVGELMLAFGIVAALVSRALPAVARCPVTWLIAALAVCGAVGTLPYLGLYGADALRDAVLWGYGAFALLVAACVLSTGALPAIVRQYSRWVMVFAAWPVCLVTINRLMGQDTLHMPGTGLPFFSSKPGDVGVHLAGAAAFVLVGLSGELSGGEHSRPNRRRVFWGAWTTSLAFVAALSRGGFIAATTALFVLAAVKPIAIGRRVAASALLAVAAGAVIVLVSATFGEPGPLASTTQERSISPGQIVENVLSISGRQSAGDLTNTRTWRLDWWRQIVDYTVHGPYFWTGKGFGINLADDDGFQVARPDEAPLRSPHNGFLTVLARMGVPGAVLFGILQVSFATSLLLAYLRAQRAGAHWWARLDLWILSYWAAFLVNALFDVFLEGPQGGICFWCLMGLGIAVLESQRRDLPRAGLFGKAA